MIDTIKVIVMNEEREIPKGMTLLELSREYQDKFHYPIIVIFQFLLQYEKIPTTLKCERDFTKNFRYRYSCHKLKFIRNFPLHSVLQSKNRSKSMKNSSYSSCLIFIICCCIFVIRLQKYNFFLY